MRVVIVSRGYPTKRFPTHGIFEFDQARALVKAGIEVIFFCVDLRSIFRRRKLGFFDKMIDGVRTIGFNVPLGRIPYKIKRFIGRLCFKKGMRYINKKVWVPDIIHSHYYFIGEFADKYCKENNVKCLLTEHSSVVHNTESSNFKFVKRLSNVYSNYNKILCVSSSLKRRIESLVSKKCYVVPNIVDTSVFNFIERRDCTFNILSVGELKRIKRMDYLISYFSKLDLNKFNSLIIIGDGPEKRHLLKEINDLDLKNRVKLLGEKNRRDIFEISKQCNCFCLLSESETFGVAFIEAISSGLPVISTHCGGPEDFINDKNGQIINLNEKSFERALDEIRTHHNSLLAKESSVEIKEMFSPTVVASKLIENYKEVLKEES